MMENIQIGLYVGHIKNRHGLMLSVHYHMKILFTVYFLESFVELVTNFVFSGDSSLDTTGRPGKLLTAYTSCATGTSDL
jgi:hypothetical protein